MQKPAIKLDAKTSAQVIRESGLKSTGARGKVLRILASTKKPLRVKDIFEKIQKEDEDMNMVTIYRTIETFVKKGIVHRVDFGEDAAYYELRDDNDHHHFITCTDCKRRDKVAGCFYNDFEPQLKSQASHFEAVTDHTVEYFGVCTACMQAHEARLAMLHAKEFAV